MKTKLVVVAAVVVLAGCSGHEMVTGGYGSGGVAGVVTMAVGMSNSSPQGVRVLVGGTGMSAVLGTDGRFSFFGVPENAELIFERSDVNARIRVTTANGPLQIELTSNTASLGRHRAAPSMPATEVEGLITNVDASSITVRDVTAKITSATVIRKGDQAVQATSLKNGDRVHMKIGSDGVALLIIVQSTDDDNGGRTITANGTVTDVGSSSLKVATQPKGTVTVNVDDNTIIKKEGNRIKLADIKVNDQVNCLGTRVDDQTLLAKQIEVRGAGGHK